MNLISVIITTYNRAGSLRGILDNFKKMRCDKDFMYEIIVVDNNSTDNTKEMIGQFAGGFDGRLRYIFEGTQGKQYALNSGIKNAKGEILAFTDDDVVVGPNWLNEINRFFNHGVSDAIGIGGKVLPTWPAEVPDWVWIKDKSVTNFCPIAIHDYGNGIIRYTKNHCPPLGCNMAFRKAAFEKYGFFNINLGTIGKCTLGEDTEYCLRLRDKGEKIYFVPEVLIFHPVEKSRLTKRYFLRWFFSSGISSLKIERLSPGIFCVFYIPAYMYKKILNKSIDALMKTLFKKDGSDRKS